ncbi:plasmalemma vesicle associated protein a [Salminus brasiliensis]|uniref:plasmalemma vesicle associated protein a n=1 Tax=Salminus brasiliensis TaxID=930266 RepID=UPI003B82CDE8
MYNSGYSQAKMGLTAKNLRRSKSKSCGYYMRIVLFFSSLIQSLIIVSLVLFLVYGEPQQTVEEKRIQELEQSYSRLSLENVALRAKEKNLTLQLNITLIAKRYSDNNVTVLRKLANTSSITINGLRMKWAECEAARKSIVQPPSPRMICALPTNDRYLEHRLQQAQELQKLLRANFTEQMLITKHELESAQKDRIRYQLEGIEIRREKSFLEERLEMYEKKCKEDFIKSLQGIPDVTKEFLKRVDDLFSKHISFQLTCDKQSIQLENIRANCSSLSTEVENKLQAYLDRVGSQITATVGANAKCMTENKRLSEDATWCIRNRTGIMEENKKVLKKTQQNNDKELERLLLDISKLNANRILLENALSVKGIEIKMLTDKVNDLNASLAVCKVGPFSGAASNPFYGSSFGTGMSSNTGSGTSMFGRTTGSSGGSSTGFGFPRPGPANTLTSGAGGTGHGSTGLSQPNSGWPAIGSTGTAGMSGLGSTGTGIGGLGRAGSSSTAFGGVGSSGSSIGRTSLGSTGQVGAGFGSAGSSGTTLSRQGTGGTGLGTFGSNSVGASPYGAGRTSSGSDLSAQINQHLKELHQFAKTE